MSKKKVFYSPGDEICSSKESLQKKNIDMFLFHLVQSANTKYLSKKISQVFIVLQGPITPVLFPRKNTLPQKHCFAFFTRLLQFETKMVIDNLVIYKSKHNLI